MSESESSANDGAAAAPIHDASLRVDPRTLSSEEQEFARMMGFADDAQTGEEARPARKSTPRKTAPPSVVADVEAPSPLETAPSLPAVDASVPSEPDPAPGLAPVVAPVVAAVVAPATEAAGAAATAVSPAPEAPPARPQDWEEIHPRASALGRQAALVERADQVAKLEATPVVARPGPGIPRAASDAPPGIDVGPLRAQLQASEARITELEATARDLAHTVEEKERALAGHATNAETEKQADALRLEVDELALERDRLGDALAAAHTARAEAESRADRLEAALRAARGPSGPVPEGERELRAEVIGLRRRLDESGAETRRLRETIDLQATDLAIARAHRDDRQNELDQFRRRIETLESERAAQVERIDEALTRQRELLALVSRIQAENVELRSTQAALEETLEARDLEISAREEHLLVTRRGLAARDEQLIDAAERLEQARHRHELLEAELERARLGQSELEEKLLRRDARIASLSKTLTRIEDAIGRPVAERAAPAAVAAVAHTEPVQADTPSERASEPIHPSERLEQPATPIPAPAPIASPALLPAPLVAWRNEKVRALSGEEAGVPGFLARRLVEIAVGEGASPLRILSLGGADPEAEIGLLAALDALDVPGTSIHVLEADEAAASARRQAIEAAGRAESISIGLWPDGGIEPGAAMDALLLGDALWPQTDPESVLDRLVSRLRPEGVVLFADRIGGGALELSPTTCEKLAELWQVLPEAWTTTEAFAAPPCPGEDGGIVAPPCEPLAVLAARFEARATIGFGHLVDLALGPTRGALVSAPGAAAEAFLTSIDALDESRSIAEGLPPRHGVAVLVRRERGEAGLAADAPESLGLAWPVRSR